MAALNLCILDTLCTMKLGNIILQLCIASFDMWWSARHCRIPFNIQSQIIINLSQVVSLLFLKELFFQHLWVAGRGSLYFHQENTLRTHTATTHSYNSQHSTVSQLAVPQGTLQSASVLLSYNGRGCLRHRQIEGLEDTPTPKSTTHYTLLTISYTLNTTHTTLRPSKCINHHNQWLYKIILTGVNLLL